MFDDDYIHVSLGGCHRPVPRAIHGASTRLSGLDCNRQRIRVAATWLYTGLRAEMPTEANMWNSFCHFTVPNHKRKPSIKKQTTDVQLCALGSSVTESQAVDSTSFKADTGGNTVKRGFVSWAGELFSVWMGGKWMRTGKLGRWEGALSDPFAAMHEGKYPFVKGMWHA